MKLRQTTTGTSKKSGFFKRAGVLGPAFVVGVAYLDPGNIATNLTASSKFGYQLLWVIILANFSAWLVQYLAAKFGVATQLSLPELMGTRINKRATRISYWLQAQVISIATDVAEVVGGAIALHLIFNISLFLGGIITALFSLAHLALRERGEIRLFEIVIFTLIGLTGIGLSSGLVINPVDFHLMTEGLIPHIENSESLLLAAGIFGATIMPHAIYAHTALTSNRLRDIKTSKSILKITRLDVSLAMFIAGAINVATFFVGAINLSGKNIDDSIIGAHTEITKILGGGVALLFAVGLLASGLASSTVGTYTSVIITQGLLRIKVTPFLQRALVLIPALIVIYVSNNLTMALVFSQVILSFGIPFALFPLVYLTSQQEIMGNLVNKKITTWVAYLLAAALTILDGVLIFLSFY